MHSWEEEEPYYDTGCNHGQETRPIQQACSLAAPAAMRTAQAQPVTTIYASEDTNNFTCVSHRAPDSRLLPPGNF